MKKTLLPVLLFMTIAGWSQSSAVTQVYAYSQVVLPGTLLNTVSIGDIGQEDPVKPIERVNYLLYAMQRRTTQISFSTIWLNGKAYQVKADSVSITPLEMDVPGKETYKETITLVPKTMHKVWTLSLGSMQTAPTRPSLTLQKLIKKSELVLVYKWKGKLYYYAVKKIKQLEPALAV